MQDHFNQQSYEDRCSGTVQVLIDMELLAHTDYFVGSYNSRSASVCMWLPCCSLIKETSAPHILCIETMTQHCVT